MSFRFIDIINSISEKRDFIFSFECMCLAILICVLLHHKPNV